MVEILQRTNDIHKRLSLLQNLFKIYKNGNIHNKTFYLRYLNHSLEKFQHPLDAEFLLDKLNELIKEEDNTGILNSICKILIQLSNTSPAKVSKLAITLIFRINNIPLSKEAIKHVNAHLFRILISQIQKENNHFLIALINELGKKYEFIDTFTCEAIGKYYPNNPILPIWDFVKREDLIPSSKEKAYKYIPKSNRSGSTLNELYNILKLNK